MPDEVEHTTSDQIDELCEWVEVAYAANALSEPIRIVDGVTAPACVALAVVQLALTSDAEAMEVPEALESLDGIVLYGLDLERLVGAGYNVKIDRRADD